MIPEYLARSVELDLHKVRGGLITASESQASIIGIILSTGFQ